jgi:parvulin-like peptidyl-prolyl isomerase
MILLPPEWVTWTPEKLQDVLVHESTHMRRLDPLIMLITQLNRCVHWFNPLAWWLQQSIAVLAEQPCDDAAIEAAHGDRHRYARHLLEIAEHAMQQNRRFSRAAISMAQHGRVESRILLILDSARPLSRKIPRSKSIALTVLAVVLTAVTASIQVTHAESSDSELIDDKVLESPSLKMLDRTVVDLPEAQKVVPQADPGLTTPDPLMTHDTVVARVNGKPILLCDVLPGLTTNAILSKYTPTVLQESFTLGLRDHLPKYGMDEIVVQAFSKSISEEKQRQIKSSFEPQFQILLKKILQDRKLTSEDELNEELTSQGSSVDSLRQQFIRQQIVNGYISRLTEHQLPHPEDLLKYYNDHITEYSVPERIHVSEIVVRFSNHGGSDGARLIMNRILDELKDGKDFSVLASSGSDNHSARFGGDLGWINRGSMTDTTLEDTLFLLKDGETTNLIERDDKFELYKVWKRESARTTSFEEAADSIRHKLSNEAGGKAREKVLNDLRSQAVVETLFDSNWNSDPAMKSADTSK